MPTRCSSPPALQAYERLVSPEQMGTLFKFMAITSAGVPVYGFDPPQPAAADAQAPAAASAPEASVGSAA